MNSLQINKDFVFDGFNLSLEKGEKINFSPVNIEDGVFIGKKTFIETNLLKWDSDFFGFPNYKISNIQTTNKKSFLEDFDRLETWLFENNCKYLFSRLSLNQVNEVNYLFAKDFELVASKYLTFCKTYQGKKVLEKNEQVKPIPNSFFEEIIGQSKGLFKFNRFRVDSELFGDQNIDLMYKNWVSDFLHNYPKGAFGIFRDGQLQSVCLISKSYFKKDFAFVNLVFNLPNASGKGNAKKLMESVISILFDEGFSRLYSNYLSSNLQSQKLFASLGFKPFNTLLELRKIYD